MLLDGCLPLLTSAIVVRRLEPMQPVPCHVRGLVVVPDLGFEALDRLV